MSKTLSREVIEELQRYKAGPAPTPRLRRADVVFEPQGADRCGSSDISRLLAALVISTQRSLAAEFQKSSASSSLAA